MTSRRWLAGGRLLAAFTGSALLLPAVFTTNAGVVESTVDGVKLAQLRSCFERPTFDGVDDPTDLLPEWYIAWRIMLQNQINRLFVGIEKRAAARALGLGLGDRNQTLGAGEGDGLGFKIEVVGDSTMRMQANALGWILSQRTTGDGRKQCFNASAKEDSDLVDFRCTGAERGVDEDGNPPEGKNFVLRLQYTKAFSSCTATAVDADYVYFGCGLHFLQLVPDRGLGRRFLDVWIHYERILEEAVSFYRSGGASNGERVPVGEAFMTTHSFAVERLEGPYLTRVREYEDRDETLMATCRVAANRLQPVHKDWPNEFEPEDICPLGIFSESGVANLNQRAEEVMDRLGVPVVQGYDITAGQAWATPPEDGRHYPALIPLELSSLLSEITTALRRERRVAAP